MGTLTPRTTQPALNSAAKKNTVTPPVTPPSNTKSEDASMATAGQGRHIEPGVLTTAEAALYLDVKDTTLEQWRWRGEGPRFVKLGRCVRYRQADLDSYLDDRVFSSTTEAQRAVKS